MRIGNIPWNKALGVPSQKSNDDKLCIMSDILYDVDTDRISFDESNFIVLRIHMGQGVP